MASLTPEPIDVEPVAPPVLAPAPPPALPAPIVASAAAIAPVVAPAAVIAPAIVAPAAVIAPAIAVESPSASLPEGQRRLVERLPFEVSVDLLSEHNFFSGFSVNVSEGGIFVATHSHRAVGTRLELRLALPHHDEPIVVLAEVRWIREHREDSDSSPGMGLRFVDLSPAAATSIQRFVQNVREPLFFDAD